MKKIFITGINGFLGSYLSGKYDTTKYIVQGSIYGAESSFEKNNLTSRQLDVSDNNKVNEILNDFDPDVIIHTAGISNVDLAEKNPQLCYEATVKGTWNIANWCNENNKQLIYCSTNAIFSGNEAPYSETSLPHPINVYGMHKYIAESIASNVKSFLIFRLILMYGWNHSTRINPVTFVINHLREGKKLNMVKGASYVNPLYVDSCCEAIWKGLELKKNREVYHLAGKERCDRFELALSVADVFGLDRGLISPVDDNYFSALAKRPFDTSYITRKAENELGFVALSLREGLSKMKNEEGK